MAAIGKPLELHQMLRAFPRLEQLGPIPGQAHRATAVRDFMIARGINANRMRTISYGKERPVAVCDDISCWSQNRRAVTTLSGAGS